MAVTRHALPNDQFQLSLAVNGKVDATSVGAIPTQVLLAQLPVNLQEKSEDVLLIGLGSGMTASAALTHLISMGQASMVVGRYEEALAYFMRVLNNRKAKGNK